MLRFFLLFFGILLVFTSSDVDAQSISNADVIAYADSARITFDTDSLTTASIDYGLTTSFGSNVSVPDTLTAHEYLLSPLLADTVYYYRIFVTDTLGNADSLYAQFSTALLPDVSNIQTVGLATTAKISFETNVPAVAHINYGTTTAYGQQVSSTDTLTTHQLTLPELENNTLYYFEIVATDTLSQVAMDASSVTSSALPVISNIVLSDTTAHSVTISYDTDVPTFVSYSVRMETAPVGQYRWVIDTDSVLSTSHSTVLDTFQYFSQNMSNPTIHLPVNGGAYKVKIIATDALGNKRTSAAQSFVTKTYGEALPAPFKSKTIGPAALVGRSSYDTATETFSLVGQGTDLFNTDDNFYFVYQDVVGDFVLETRINWVAGTFSNLAKAGTHFRVDTTSNSAMFTHSYNYRYADYFYYRPVAGANHSTVAVDDLQAFDGETIWARFTRSGNTFLSEYSSDGVTWAIHGPTGGKIVALPRAGMIGIVSISKTLEYLELQYDNVSLSFPADVTPPVISNVSALPVNNTGLVSYEANEWVTTIVDVGLTTSYTDSVYVDTVHVANTVTLDNLAFSTEYHYRIRAFDADSNEFVSPDMTFITEGNTQLPVELSRFAGSIDDGAVVLTWALESKNEMARFEVQRSLDGSFANVGVVEASSETNGQYAYSVAGLDYGFHNFRLRLISLDGRVSYSAELEVELTLANSFELLPAYPNPFVNSARFALTIREAQPVRIELYNAAGQLVRVLHDGMLEGNSKREFVVDGSNLSGGLYFYRVKGTEFSDTGKLVLMK